LTNGARVKRDQQSPVASCEKEQQEEDQQLEKEKGGAGAGVENLPDGVWPTSEIDDCPSIWLAMAVRDNPDNGQHMTLFAAREREREREKEEGSESERD